MLTICGRNLPDEKVPLHQARCSACGGNPPNPPGSTHPADYFSDDEAMAVIAHTRLRHWRLLFYLLYETGIRIGEGLAVTKKDVYMETNEVGIWVEKQKAPQYERCAVSAELIEALLAYARKLRGQKLFPYSYWGAIHALQVSAQLSGFDRPIRTHMFRHTKIRAAGHITGLTAAEGLAIGQGIAHHKRMETTMRYMQASERDVKTAARKLLESP